jgi:hypothetical protein
MMIWLLVVFIYTADGEIFDLFTLHAATEQQCRAKLAEISAKNDEHVKGFCTIAPPLDGKIKG